MLQELQENSWQENLKTDSILALPIRFDKGLFRNPEITPEGYLRAEAVYCRDGILTYRTPDGKVRKELRLPDTNKSALTGFGLKPYTTEHPPVLLDASNALAHAKGMTDSTVYYDPKAGFVRGVIAVFDSQAIDSIKNGNTVEISAGYQCVVKEEPGTWRGERYDAIQDSLRPNHIAGTAKGRAGPDVKFLNLFDSYASIYGGAAYEDPDAISQQYFVFPTRKDSKKSMATIARNGLTFEDVPGDLASFITQELNRQDSELRNAQDYISELETAARQDAESITVLNSAVEEKDEEASRALGRADELETYLTNADSLLSDIGYHRDSDGDYYREDKKGMPAFLKKKFKEGSAEEEAEEEAEETDDEEAEEDDEDDDDVEEVVIKKSKYKAKAKAKKDSAEDSVADRLTAWKEAEKLIPGLMDSDHFDSDLDVSGIRRLAIAELRPNRDLTGRSDSYVEGVYEELLETHQPQARVDHTDNLENLLSSVARNGATSSFDKARAEQAAQLADAWKTPLSMSTRK